VKQFCGARGDEQQQSKGEFQPILIRSVGGHNGIARQRPRFQFQLCGPRRQRHEAACALLASRYLSGGSKEPPASARPNAAPISPSGSMPDISSGTILDGLGGLLRQFQQRGLGDAIDSWINTGPNKAVALGQISDALGPDVIDG
jgi:hypothetical protein